MSEPIQVLVVDDHPLFRHGIVNSLNETGDITVVGEASSGQEAIDKAHELLPDVILLDITMRPMDGLEVLRRLTAELPICRIIMLTVMEDDDTLLNALKAGAKGYVLKGVSANELAQIVRKVAAGEVYISMSMAASLLVEMAVLPPKSDADPIDILTERERAILELVAQGDTNKQIGQKLHLAEKTVKHYITNILQKLQVNNRVQAALIAQQRGLLKGGDDS